MISFAPILKALIEGGSINRPWLQWFQTIGNGLNGLWSHGKRVLTKTGVSVEPTIEYISYQGRQISFLLEWPNGVVFTNATLALGRQDLTMVSGMLQVWGETSLIDGAYCQDSTITLPDINSSTRIVVQGTILTKVQEEV